MTTEKFVMWLEAIPVAVAGFLLALFHPANCFKNEKEADEQMELPETPPHSFNSVPYNNTTHPNNDTTRSEDSEKSRTGSKYGNVVMTLDPTFDRKNWR